MKYIIKSLVMISYLSLIILLAIPIQLSSQLNLLTPTTKDNVATSDFYKVENKYIIPFIFSSQIGEQGTSFLVIDTENDNSIIEIDNPNIFRGLHTLNFDSDSPYMVGRPVDDNTVMRIVKFTDDLEGQEEVYDYDIMGVKSINSGFTSLEDKLYVVNVNNLVSGETQPRHLQWWKIDSNGQLLDTKMLNEHTRISYAFDMFVSHDKSLFITSSNSYPNINGGFQALTKMKTNGDVIWQYENDEKTEGGSNIWAAELSDSSIVSSYEVFRWNDPIFVGNNWNIRPTRLKWVDKDGNPFREKYIVSPKQTELTYSGLLAGKGDYFFGHGEISEEGDFEAGFITKFSNEGDTIWSKKYQHPDYSGIGPGHEVRDLIELENGDLAVLTQITVTGDRSYIWLFELNENGCFKTDECGTYNIVATEEIEGISNIVAYPNPFTDQLSIEVSDNRIAKVSLVSIDGIKIISQVANGSRLDFDVVDLPSGVYVVSIQYRDGRVSTEKVVKI